MTKAQGIRFSFIALLWLALCWLLIKTTPVINLLTIFELAVSFIIVFVPLYKKYKRNGKTGNN